MRANLSILPEELLLNIAVMLPNTLMDLRNFCLINKTCFRIGAHVAITQTKSSTALEAFLIATWAFRLISTWCGPKTPTAGFGVGWNREQVLRLGEDLFQCSRLRVIADIHDNQPSNAIERVRLIQKIPQDTNILNTFTVETANLAQSQAKRSIVSGRFQIAFTMLHLVMELSPDTDTSNSAFLDVAHIVRAQVTRDIRNDRMCHAIRKLSLIINLPPSVILPNNFFLTVTMFARNRAYRNSNRHPVYLQQYTMIKKICNSRQSEPVKKTEIAHGII